MVATSILLGKVLSITAGAVRISLENLPVLMAGVCFGPIAGAMVGVTADLLGSFLVGFAINPIITMGAGAVGFVAGMIYKPPRWRWVSRLRKWSSGRKANREGPASEDEAGKEETRRRRLLLSVGLAHFAGSVLIKTAGLVVYHYATWHMFFYRLLVYIGTGAVEYYLLTKLLPIIFKLIKQSTRLLDCR